MVFYSANYFVVSVEMQPTFESELRKNLETFKTDKIDYVNEYQNTGPMQPGLTPREASDKLILFQVYEIFVVEKLKLYKF